MRGDYFAVSLAESPGYLLPLQIESAYLSGTSWSHFLLRYLFTMLYTVIPNNDGLQALKYHLDLRPEKQPPTHTLVRLAELVLTLNCFDFDGNYYQQVGGVAMGT